jgi:TolB protein
MDVQIYRIRRDGSELTQLTDLPGRINLFPAWSPDGTRLVIRRDNDLHLINSSDGSEPLRLTENQGTPNQMGVFSPDGTRIAFLSNREGYGSVFITNSDGSGQFNFTPRPAGYPGTWNSRAPAWSPNGEFIFYGRALGRNGK